MCSTRSATTAGVLYVPTDSENVFLRRLLTAEEANRLLNEIPAMEAFEEPNAKALRLRYTEAMHTHTPSEWVRVIKTVRERVSRIRGQFAGTAYFGNRTRLCRGRKAVSLR